MPSSYDIVGSIAVLKFRDEKLNPKKNIAREILKQHSNIKTVVEKSERVKGRLRTIKIRHLAGVKTSIAEYKENGCRFKFDIEKCYFSSRLASERMEIAKIAKKTDEVLVMFAGAGFYPIVIEKIAKPKKIVSVELGRKCCEYALINNKLNKSHIEVFQGDVKRIVPKLDRKFSFIVMPRPNLKETFLKEAFGAAKKGARIVYYTFCQERDFEETKSRIIAEAKLAGKKMRFLQVKKAGDIAPYTFRWRVVFRV